MRGLPSSVVPYSILKNWTLFTFNLFISVAYDSVGTENGQENHSIAKILLTYIGAIWEEEVPNTWQLFAVVGFYFL